MDACLAFKEKATPIPQPKATFSLFGSSENVNNQVELPQNILSIILASNLLELPSGGTLLPFSAILTLLSCY